MFYVQLLSSSTGALFYEYKNNWTHDWSRERLAAIVQSMRQLARAVCSSSVHRFHLTPEMYGSGPVDPGRSRIIIEGFLHVNEPIIGVLYRSTISYSDNILDMRINQFLSQLTHSFNNHYSDRLPELLDKERNDQSATNKAAMNEFKWIVTMWVEKAGMASL